MWFKMTPVEAAYAREAPFHFLNEADVAVPPERVWAVLLADASYPHWNQDFVSLTWTRPPSSERDGVGAQRVMKLRLVTAEESFVVWEPARRMAFRMDRVTLPMVQAMMEDITMSPNPDGGTHIRWEVSYTPRPWVRLIHPIVRIIFGDMFRKTLQGLVRYLKSNP